MYPDDNEHTPKLTISIVFLKISSKVSRLNASLWIYTLFGILYALTFSWSSSTYPADIPGGRESFEDNRPNDFFGTFAGLAYFLIPEWPLGWARNLTFIQVSIAMVGLGALLQFKRQPKCILLLLIFAVQYLVAIFSSHQTRDGAHFSLMVFAFGLIRYSHSVIRLKKTLFLLGAFLLVCGMTFRPALSASAIVFLLFLGSASRLQDKLPASKMKSVFLVSLLLVLPTTIELGLTRILVSKSSYPIQTVVLQDLGFAACQSANSTTVEQSVRALSILALDTSFDNRLCQFYRIYTWQSLLGALTPTSLTSDFSPPIRRVLTSHEFESLSNNWLNILVSDPKTYIQGKLVSFTQVFFSNQTKIWPPIQLEEIENFPSALSHLVKLFSYVLHIPWIILSSTYILSPGIALVFTLLFNSYLSRRYSLPISRLSLISTGLAMALFSNVIFFVSDNARYTTAYVILAIISYTKLFIECKDNVLK